MERQRRCERQTPSCDTTHAPAIFWKIVHFQKKRRGGPSSRDSLPDRSRWKSLALNKAENQWHIYLGSMLINTQCVQIRAQKDQETGRERER